MRNNFNDYKSVRLTLKTLRQRSSKMKDDEFSRI